MYVPGAAPRGINTHPSILQSSLVKSAPNVINNWDYNKFNIHSGGVDVSGVTNYEGKILLSNLQRQFNLMLRDVEEARRTPSGIGCNDTCVHAQALGKIFLTQPYNLDVGYWPQMAVLDEPWDQFLRASHVVQREMTNMVVGMMFVRYRALTTLNGFSTVLGTTRMIRSSLQEAFPNILEKEVENAQLHFLDKFNHLQSTWIHGACVRIDAIWTTIAYEVLLREKNWMPMIERQRIQNFVEQTFRRIYRIEPREVMAVSKWEIFFFGFIFLFPRLARQALLDK